MNTEVVKNEKCAYTLMPPVDIYETENEFIVKADVPGVKKEDIEITLNDNKLEIRGKASGNER
jgi:HSP20 family protein